MALALVIEQYTSTTVTETKTMTVTSIVYAYSALSPIEIEVIKYMAEKENLHTMFILSLQKCILT